MIKKKKLYLKFCCFLIFILFLFISLSIHNVNAEQSIYNYEFDVNTVLFNYDLVNQCSIFYGTTCTSADHIEIYIDSCKLKLYEGADYADVTDCYLEFLYYDFGPNDKYWEFTDCVYNIHGIPFSIMPISIIVHNFNMFAPSNVKYNGNHVNEDTSYYSWIASVTNHYFHKNNTLSCKMFNIDFLTYYDTFIYSGYDETNTLRFVTRFNDGSHFINRTNGGIVYATADLPFLTIWGDVGIFSNYLFLGVRAIGSNNTITDRDTQSSMDTFFTLVSNIVTIPIYYLQCLFNFNILGLNIYIVIFSFIGLVVLVYCIVKLRG